MSLDKTAIAKIAKLARLHVPEEKLEHFAQEISGILHWIEQLNEVNTDGVPELTSVSAVTLPRRKDVVSDGNIQEAILVNAPDKAHGCFAVPKVIE